jgi:hypothetical protein
LRRAELDSANGEDMANIDAFSAQIVRLVRQMPDDAILALVKHQLDTVVSGAAVPRGPGRPPSAAKALVALAPQKGARTKATRKRAATPSAERQEALDKVERIVKSSSGMSASQVASTAGIPQTRAAAVLKELKLARRIFQGGDRRFARYAGDAKTAEQASLGARQNAAGPLGGKPAAKGRKRSAK